MVTLAIAVHILVSIVLVATVLLQSGKGAAIGSSFGGSSNNTLFGSSGPATFLTKLTAVCAVIFMLTSLYLTFLASRTDTESVMDVAPVIKEIPASTEAAPE